MRITPILFNNGYSALRYNKEMKPVIHNNIEFSRDYANCVKAQAIYNLSFTGKSSPVYKIDENLNCTYYEKQVDLAKELDVSSQDISAGLCGRRNSINGFVFAHPEQIETQLGEGRVEIDKKKVAELYFSRTQQSAVYAVDYMGNIEKYSKASDIESKKGLVIVKASEVERFNKDGQVIVNRKKLSTRLIQDSAYNAIYAFDKQGNITKYENQTEYAKKKGVSKTAVYNALQKQNRMVLGEQLVPAKEVETVLKDGTIIIDDDKLIDYFSKKYRPSSTRRYTVTENMQLTRYETTKALADGIGVKYETLVHLPDRVTPNGEYIIPASEIEELGKNGQFVVNQIKLSRALWERTSKEAIYTIDINGNMKKHKDAKQAAQALDRSEKTIYSVLYEDGIHQTVADNVVVRACDIESMDENGNIIIDRRKVTELIQKKLCPNAVYLVDKNGKCKKYKNRFSMANELGVPHSRGNLRINGFAIVDARFIEEINEDGFIALNPDKVAFYAKHSKASF